MGKELSLGDAINRRKIQDFYRQLSMSNRPPASYSLNETEMTDRCASLIESANIK